MRKLTTILVLLAANLVIAQSPPAGSTKTVPPSMAKRPIPKLDAPPPGRRVDIVDGDCKTLLFVPEGYVLPDNGDVRLTIHFHTPDTFIIPEHLRRGMKEPLLVAHLGEGSSTYGRPFTDPDRLSRILEIVADSLSTEKTPAKVKQIDITSFSAGYGAVREIIKQDRYIDLIRRIILADSLYAGWDPATTQPGAASRPALENMGPFVKFLELAARGEKTFVLTHSHVPTSYANTAANAAWIIDRIGLQRREVERGSIPATLDPQYPLIYRADKGRLHIWGYGGEDAGAHVTHVRHIADVWMALDEAAED